MVLVQQFRTACAIYVSLKQECKLLHPKLQEDRLYKQDAMVFENKGAKSVED